MARKSQSKSNNRAASSTRSGSRKVHPKRMGIVWGVFVGAMTFAGGVLMLGENWQGIPAVRVAESGAAPGQSPVAPGRWQAIVIHLFGVEVCVVHAAAADVRHLLQQREVRAGEGARQGGVVAGGG